MVEPALAGAILREVYTGVSGGNISDLTSHWKYPNSPDSTNWVTDLFEAQINIGDDYGQRMRGYIVPPQTGSYTFWIASDDHSELWISTNAAPLTNLVRVAYLYDWANSREWEKVSTQKSAPIYLEAGKLYYFQALMKEGGGGDNLAVRWQRPDGVVESPMPAAYAVPPGGPFAPPQIAAQSPDTVEAVEGAEVTFLVVVSNMYPLMYQWQQDGGSIGGATASNHVIDPVSLSQSGAVFRCVMSNRLGSVTSATSTLVVIPDTNRPSLSAVYNVGTTLVYVVFNEAVASNTATLASNYKLTGGVNVSGASFGSDGRIVVLNVATLTTGTTYTLTVSNVTDRAAASNAILPGTQWTFVVREFSPVSIGNPAQPPVVSYTTNGFGLTIAGAGFGGTSDEGALNYVLRSGNFDVRVRLEGLDISDAWARAGIMARATLNADSDFAAVFGTPTIGGVFFEYRGAGANLLDNGDFESGQGEGLNPAEWGEGWPVAHALTNNTALPGGRRAPSAARSGAWMMMLTNNASTSGNNWHGTGQLFPCSVGSRYLLSGHYVIVSNLVAGQSTLVKLEWYDSWTNRLYAGDVEGQRLSFRQSDWTYAAVTGTAPASAAFGKAVVLIEDMDGRVNTVNENFHVYWDDCAVKAGTAGDTIRGPSQPVNYPETWLRLRRQGDVFTGFVSYDGQRWTMLGSVSNGMPSTIYLGMAAASHNGAETTTAQFRDWGNVSGGTTGRQAAASVEAPGPSTRRSGLVFSEIMYHPEDREDGKDLEFIEIFNTDPFDYDLTGWRISGDISYAFPPGTTIRGGGILVVANQPADVQSVYGIGGVLGGYPDKLPNGSGVVRLRNELDAVLLEVEYADRDPWPFKADGLGHSLVLARPSYGEADPRAWAASAYKGGSPGRLDPVAPPAYASVVINEVLSHTDLPQVDFIELYNHSMQSVSISGFRLIVDTNTYVVPGSTTIPPRGFYSVTEPTLGFTLQKEGGRVVVLDAQETRVVDAVIFGAMSNGVSIGRFPNGSPGFHELATPTAGTNNAALLIRQVVINEIMYNPISGSDDDEYIELYNRGAGAVNIGNWRITDGVSFTFPTNTIIPAGGYLVVGANASNLIAKYSQLAATNTVGNYSGKLSDRGERIALEMPEDPVLPDRAFMVVDEVTYGDGEDWGLWADGGGSSLELIDSRGDNRLAGNWAGSDESLKSAWTTLSVTGILDNGNGAIEEVHLLMFDAGECLVDDIDARVVGGGNRCTNGTFSSGSAGWLIQGNHVLSTAGTNLHIRATGGGDTAANRIEARLSSAFSAGQNVALSMKVRWIAGYPGIILRLRGAWLELAETIPVPANLGSPGMVNSRAVSNAGPAMGELKHTPAIPAANEDVLVTVRVHDPDSVQFVSLRYRLDPSTTTNTLTMYDDGSSGDEVGGDGIYSRTITGLSTGSLVAFRIRAVDFASPIRTNVYPNPATDPEALIRFGDDAPSGNLGAYRMWMTRQVLADWTNAPLLSNQFQPGTFVAGDRVVYNAGAHYRGSPFIRLMYNSPTGVLCAYRFELPKSDRFLGVTSLNLDTLEPGRDNTYQRERAMFWMAQRMGVPISYQRYVRVYFNGTKRGEVYGDVQHLNADYVGTWYPDFADGDLFKVDDWFEFTNQTYEINYMVDNRNATLEEFTTTGGAYKKSRYRWSWEKKSNKGINDDYEGLFGLVAAMNEPNATSYFNEVTALIDVDQWMSVLALRHVVCDWDGYGYARGKNAYMYKAPGLPWQMLLWDLDFGLGTPDSHPQDMSLFHEIQDPTISNKFLRTSPFRRAFLQTAKAIVEGPMLYANINPVMDDCYTALRMNGVDAYPPAAAHAWIAQRRQWVLDQLQGYEAPFEITSNGGAAFSTNRNFLTLAGTAPLAVRTLTVNGVAYTPQWTSVQGWAVSVTLADGVNTLEVKGYDSDGNEVAGASDSIQVTYTGSGVSPVGNLVINEIMYNPTNVGAEFVEIHNRSLTHAFDLYDYRLQGLDFTFSGSVVVPPGAYAVVAEDAVAFVEAHGSVPIAAVYGPGSLDNGGELLRLIQLNGTSADVVVDEVIYDDGPPWPASADGFGPSLQLIDSAEDNNRVGNWAADTNTLFTPGASNSVTRDLPSFPLVWLNELQATNVSGMRDNASDRDPWLELYNAEGGQRSLTNFYLTDTYTNLVKWRFPTNAFVPAAGFRIVWLDNEPGETAGTTNYHATFRPSLTTGSVALVYSNAGATVIVDYMNYAAIPADRSYGSFPDGVWTNRALFLYPTPGGTNNGAGAPVTVRINEWMADNDNTITNFEGEYEDWIELYNYGAGVVDLTDFTLTDNLTSPAKWTFPTGTTIAAGGFLLIWADSEAEETNGLHTSWSLSKDGEAIGFFTPDGWVVDSLVFGPQETDISEGRWPDASPNIYTMAIPTPLAPNIVSTNNTAPTLDAVGAKVVDEHSLLQFTVTADDSDTPAQTLTFSLDPGAPAGAAITPQTGVFTWTPSEADGPSTNSVTIRVTDNGYTNRSASETIDIEVEEINEAPVAGVMSDLGLAPGSRLSLLFAATDADLPANMLTFSLVAGAPSGAAIDGATGLFSWMPSEAQALSTNTIRVRIQDDGVPALSDTGSVEIVVYGMDRLFEADVWPMAGATGFVVRWSAESGELYRVESADQLVLPVWGALAGDVTATSSVAEKPDPNPNTVSQRFYRIMRLLP